MFSIGIDIGYTSVKMAVLDQGGAFVYSGYRLHRGNARAAVKQFIEEIAATHRPDEIKYGAVTGSGGRILTGTTGVLAVNEVAALVEGAGAASPEARSIIEIGGQSAKYVSGLGERNRSRIKISINSNCSAGTGSFFEEQVSRLGLKLEDYSEYAARAKSIPRIAGRCSVFAKTDITHHQQEGVPLEDILLGLSFAAVRNFRTAVLKKAPLEKPVLLAGGVARNASVLTALKSVLDLDENDLVLLEQGDRLGALGAALIARKEHLAINLGSLISGLESLPDEPGLEENGAPLPALAMFGRDSSAGKHDIVVSPPTDCQLDVFLGVDVGSTTTKLVLADGDDRIIGFRYLRTLGDPASAVRQGLSSLKKEFGHRLNVLAACTTGSGRFLACRLIGADSVKDEITAQARAAAAIDPGVDTIFEIGGQDSKFISIRDGVVVDFQMNKICAAGTGSFIEEQAQKFDIPLSQIGSLALASVHPVNLGERCTVFIESSIAAHLGRGAKLTDLTAGLCYAVVRNYLNRVVGQKKIGNRVLFQGGVAHNQGVVNAFRSLTGKDIIVPPFFSVTGAYGAAIIAREESAGRQTHFKGFEPEPFSKAVELSAEPEMKKPSAFNASTEALIFEGYTGVLDPAKKTVGIPRALFTYGLFPMFHRFFTELGFNVLLSEPTSEKTIALGQEHSLDETCYPVKLINGHVAELVGKKVDFLFFPDLYTVDHPGSPSRRNFGCPYMQLAFKAVNYAMNLKNKGIRLLAPTIASSLGKSFMMNSFAGLGKQLGVSHEETVRALQEGMKAFQEFEARMARAGQTAMEGLDPEKKAFILISKIYGVADPVLNMGIADKLAEMGYQVLPFYCLPEVDISREHPNMYWPFGQHILEPAPFIREHPNLYAILLTHHGCGPDSVLAHFFREMMQGKPFLHIEVDEHSSSVGLITRVEAFVNSLNNLETTKAEKAETYLARTLSKDENIKKDFRDLQPDATVYLPQMEPYADMATEILRAEGVAAETLPPTNREAVDIGRSFTIAEEYFSLTCLLGDVVRKCRSQADGKPVAFLLPRNEGAEVDGQYSRTLRMKLDEEGYTKANIVSPFLEDLLDLKEPDARLLFWAMLAGDLVRAAPPENRDDHKNRIFDMIRQRRLTIGNLSDLAREIFQERQNQSCTKRILAIGEPLVLYNDFMNGFLFKSLEEQGHQVFYAPFSEAMWLLWRDYVDQNGQRNHHSSLLNRFKNDVESISACLGEESPFEKNLNDLAARADRSIGYYAGAFGRYRGAKVSAPFPRTDGIITVASTYENTGTSLNILEKDLAEEDQKPVLHLTFDGQKNESDITKRDSFLYYL